MKNIKLETLNDQLEAAERDLATIREYKRQYISGDNSLFEIFEKYGIAIELDAPQKQDWEELYNGDINQVMAAYPGEFSSEDDYTDFYYFCENSNAREFDTLEQAIKTEIEKMKDAIKKP